MEVNNSKEKVYSFERFQKKAIAEGIGLDKYMYLINNLHNCDVSKDVDGFQKCFNSFFRVRGRKEEWINAFYSYFEEKKDKKVTFDEILDYMYDEVESVEASFCSKMLSIINPDMPVIDKYVLKELDLKIEGKNEEKLGNAKRVYKEVIEKEKELLRINEKSINEFKQLFADYDISPNKVLDFMLWMSGKEKEDK